MRVSSKNTSNFGGLENALTSWMLIGRNSGITNISIQYSEVEPGCEQPLHKHEPEQCYYIIDGVGLMTINEETHQVSAGEAIYIPGNALHGIRNAGNSILKYLTANTPSFDLEYENLLWPNRPK
ncbi:MAG: cupin domain-containing protein [Candidatus Saccharibacteria bacterium]